MTFGVALAPPVLAAAGPGVGAGAAVVVTTGAAGAAAGVVNAAGVTVGWVEVLSAPEVTLT